MTNPFPFGLDDRPRSTAWGDHYWTVGLPDGRELSLYADDVEVLSDGALRCWGTWRKVDQDGVPVEDSERGEPKTTLLLPAGAWTHAYAASCLDGDAVAVDHLPKPGKAS